jgi:hypothetical protein
LPGWRTWDEIDPPNAQEVYKVANSLIKSFQAEQEISVLPYAYKVFVRSIKRLVKVNRAVH